MLDAAILIKEPLKFKELFYIYPPTVRQVVVNSSFNQYLKILTLSQEEIEDEFVANKVETKKIPTPFEFLLINAFNSEEIAQITKDAFMFFTHTNIEFLFEIKSILIGSVETALKESSSIKDLKILKEEDFFELQNKVRSVVGLKEVEAPDPDEDPRVKRIKAKARYRDKIKAKKGGGISLSTSLLAICCMGIGITPLTIGEMSYAAVSALMEMYQEKEKYQLDIDSLLAGADSKKVKPQYWIK